MLRTLLILGLSFASFGFGATTIKIDGSSTVYPISEAMAEEFGAQSREHARTRITIGVSGTGGGFKKFCSGDIDIANASRHMKDSEKAECKKNKVAYVELPVAFDGITIAVNPKNTWAKDITKEELAKLWGPGSKIKTWKEIRPDWPDQPIKLYGPGTDSGTFDYFTEAINGKAQASRADFTKSEDDNVLVTGIAGDINALGYFGYAYYQENASKIKAVAVKGEKSNNAVLPTLETIKDGSYEPLARPVFIYVNPARAKTAEVADFVKFFLKQGETIVKDVGFIPLNKAQYEQALKQFETALNQHKS
jgi:phosphate transport system substrate-binding protein